MVEDNDKIVTTEETVVTPPIVPVVSKPVIAAPAAQNLTAANPGHPDYDPAKDPKVRDRENKLFSKIAERDIEVKSIKEILESTNKKLSAFEKEKKIQEDKDKSELQLASEKTSGLEQKNTTLASELAATKESNAKTVINLNARLLLMEELNRANITTNAAEWKGLQVELEDKLSKKKDTDEPADIAKTIVTDFGKDRESTFIPTQLPKPLQPEKIEPTNIENKLRELSKDYEKNKDEIKAILKQIDDKDKQR